MPSTTAFRKAYKALNERQREAVDAIDGPVMVVAGPGTGKTQVLTMRIANILLKTDVPPEAVLALTFTEKAASSMRTRLIELIGPTAYRVRISTFHAFANEVIHAEPDKFPRLIGGTNITEPDQLALIEALLVRTNATTLRPTGRPEAYVKAILGAIGDLKGKAITHAQFKQHIDTEKQRELLEIWRAYEQYLTTTNRYDFADMLCSVAHALECDENLRAQLREKFLYVLIDEHQDTNTAQNRIVQFMLNADSTPNVFVVGDLEQAIYRFQGASPENFRDFSHRYPATKIVRLDKNYRSTQTILDAAQQVSPGQGKLVACATYPKQHIRLCSFSSPMVQEWSVARMAQERIAQGTRPGNIAILYRTNAEAAAFTETCARLNVPFAVRGDDEVLGDLHIQKLLHIIRAAACMPEPGPLAIALHLDLLGCSPLDAHKIAVVRDRNPWDVIRLQSQLKKLNLEDEKAALNAYAILKAIAMTIKNSSAPYALQEAVQLTGFVAKATGLADGNQVLEKLHALFDMVRVQQESNKQLKLDTFLETLDRLALHRTDLKVELSASANAVQLMTAHRAKGLEFDTVFIVNALRGHWDGARKPIGITLPFASEDDADDVRRLFYVAMTRGKKEVIVTWPQRKLDGKECLPSTYALAIPELLREYADMQPYEHAYLEHRNNRLTPPKRSAPFTERAYLTDLFNQRGLTVTALNNYLECPWRYFFSNLIRIPEAPSLAGEQGTAAHRALRSFFDRLTAGEHVNEAYLISQFETALRKSPLSNRDIDRIIREGSIILKSWHAFWKENGGWNTKVQTEVPINDVLLDDIPLSGKLDKVELFPNYVHVVDYKTKEPMSRNAIMGLTKSSTGNEWRQLVFYKILLDRWHTSWNMTSGSIDFLEPTPAGNYKRESFDVTPAHCAELEATIRQVAHDIRTLAFWDKRCSDRTCRFCGLRNLMQH